MDIPNSSTSSSSSTNSEHHWRNFVLVGFSALFLFPLLCFGFVLVMDPYDNLSFSPDFDRVPVDSLQRLFHPALARKAEFDSAVIGNSNIRLLRPDQLNQIFGGRFVNLGMDAASSWEQEQIFNIFARNHQKIGTVIFGMDFLWCKAEFAEQNFVGFNTEANFPDWMYDERTNNDLPPLNLGSLKHAWRQMLAILGLQASHFGRDGYTVFTKPMSEYNIDRARFEIYGSIEPRKKEPVIPSVEMTPEQRAEIPFPALNRLEQMLGSLPETTKKILFFVPYHNFYQARQGSEEEILWRQCKEQVATLSASMNNAYVIDFMINSSITLQDSNYWDYKHYTVDVAEILVDLLGQGINDGTYHSDYRLLYPLSEP